MNQRMKEFIQRPRRGRGRYWYYTIKHNYHSLKILKFQSKWVDDRLILNPMGDCFSKDYETLTYSGVLFYLKRLI